MPIQTPKKRKLFASTLKRLFLGVLVGVLGTVLLLGVNAQKTNAATSDTLNFQAKLMTSAGGIAADGNYNVEFNLYNQSSGGTALWTEDWLNNAGAGEGVRVTNGYLSVNLGTHTAFPSTINWDQNLWIGMTVRGTGSCNFGSCTPADSEMTPRLKLTAVPYALSAGNLSNANGSVRSTLMFQGGTVGDQVFQIDDQGAAGTYHLLAKNSGNVDYYIQNQSSGGQSANIFIQSAAGGTAAALFQGASNATAPSLVARAGSGQTGNLLELQNSSGVALSNFDVNGQLTLGRITSSGTTQAGSIRFADGTTDNFSATIQTSTLTADRKFVLPDTSLATTASPATICVFNGATSNCPAATGSAYYIHNDTALQTSANFNIQAANDTSTGTDGTVGGVIRGAAGGQTVDLFQLQQSNGTVEVSFTAAGNLKFGNDADHNIIIAQASSGTGNNLTIQAGQGATTGNQTGGNLLLQAGAGGGSGNTGAVIVRANGTNTATAFQVQNASSVAVFTVDTTNTGTVTVTGALTAANGDVNINNNSNFNTNINTGTSTGTVSIGSTSNTGNFALESGSSQTNLFNANSNHTIKFATGTGVQNITLGSTSSTSSMLLQAGLGDLQLTTQGTGTLGIGNNAVAQNIFVGNTTGSTGIIQKVGTGNYLLDGVGASTYSIGASTVAGTITIGGTGETGDITLGQSTATNTVSIASAIGNGAIQTINIGTSGTSGSTTNVTIGSTIAGTINLQSAGGVKVGSLGAVQGTSVAICRDTSTGLLTSCDGGSGGKPFLQSGNAFGTTAVLGTTDANGLQIITGGSTTGRAYFDTSNNLYLGNANSAGVAAAPTDFTIRGTDSSTSGTRGGALTIKSGSGTVANSNGGDLTIQSGAGSGTGTAGALKVNLGATQFAQFNSTSSTISNIPGGNITAFGNLQCGQSLSNNCMIQGGSGLILNSKGTAAKTVLLTDATSTASANSGDIIIATGNATGATSNSGSIIIDNGTATGTVGSISIGTANASGVTVGRTGITTTLQGDTKVTLSATTGTTLVCQNGTGILAGCTNSYQVAGNYLVQVPTANSGAGSNAVAPTAAGIVGLKVTGTTGTAADAVQIVQGGAASAINITQSTNPGSGNASIFINNTAGAGNFVDFRNSNTSKFTVDANGNVVVSNSLTSSSTAVTVNSTGASGTQDNGVSVSHTGAGTLTSGFNVTNNNASGTLTNGLNITNTAGTLTNGLNFTGTIGTDINRTTGSLSINGGGGVSIQAGTSNTISIGTSNANSVQIGAVGASTNASTIDIADTTNATGAQVVKIGAANNNSGSLTTIQGGINAAAAIVLQTGNNGTTAGGITIGNTSGAFTQAINIGTNATASSTTNVTIGSTIAGTTTFQSGGGNIFNYAGTGNAVQLTATGNPSAGTNALLVVNNNATTPSGNLLALQNKGTNKFTVDANGNVVVGNGAGTGSLTNNGSTTNSVLAISNSSGVFGTGTAAGTVDIYTAFSISAGTTGLTYSPPTPTANTIYGRIIYVSNIGLNTFNLGAYPLKPGATATMVWSNTNGGASWQYAGADGASILNQTTQQTGANFNIDGTGTAGTFKANTFDAATGSTISIGSSATTVQFLQGGSRTINIQQSTGTTGNSLTVAGGQGATGNNSGGALILTGGAGTGSGVQGLVQLAPTTFLSSGSTQSFGGSGSVTGVDSFSTIAVTASTTGLTVTVPIPAAAGQVVGRIIYITAVNGTNDFNLALANSSGVSASYTVVGMKANNTATLVWNGYAWTAAGASSSTDLQSAYNNTLSSAGAAELVLSNSTNHDGLTIRDSLTSSVSSNTNNGTLLEVQTGQAANLFSVNSKVNDYANNGGAENALGSEWAGFGTGASISRNTNATYIANGTGSVKVTTTGTAATGAKNVLNAALTANLHYTVSFAAKLDSASSGSFNDLEVDFSKTGSAADVACTNYSTQTIPRSTWVKVNCNFTASASGITSSNAILIRQTAAGSRSWYVDNLSVTIAADLNYATDGGVDDGTNFATNWPQLGTATITRDTAVGNDTSDSTKVVTAASTNQGVKNVLSINPLSNTLYRISVYVKLNSGTFNDFSIAYSPDDGGVGGANVQLCTDYNTQTVTTTGFTQITCYVTTGATSVSAPRIYFYQPTGTARTFWVDTFSMTMSSNAVPNVQIGGGVTGGPTTLLTLDRAASAPIAANNDALLGSMYYDTTLGKLQCYESDGWGACGSSPDNIVTISPEYTNAVMHGPSGGTSGVGTMISDLCSDTLNINDGSSGQDTICGTNETYNFYRWSSPQATNQTYAIYVTYQLPTTFKSFASGSTSIMGRTDNGPSGGAASVTYKVYRNNSVSGLTQCGTAVSVSSGNVSSWQLGQASGAADPSTCGFTGGDSIVFEIDMTANKDAKVYVGNLGFTFSNK